MKHSESGIRKVIKQLRKCPEIEDIVKLRNGHKIVLVSGEERVTHFCAKAFHPLRRWLKQRTSIQNLKF